MTGLGQPPAYHPKRRSAKAILGDTCGDTWTGTPVAAITMALNPATPLPFRSDAAETLHRADDPASAGEQSACPRSGTRSGINDFLELLAQWGVAGSCDFDGGGVGINDFLQLLLARY